jgi:hypothetical protein
MVSVAKASTMDTPRAAETDRMSVNAVEAPRIGPEGCVGAFGSRALFGVGTAGSTGSVTSLRAEPPVESLGRRGIVGVVFSSNRWQAQTPLADGPVPRE